LIASQDGAAAAIICSEAFIIKHGLQATAVEIKAMSLRTDTGSTFADATCMRLVGYEMSKQAAEECYRRAGVSGHDVDDVDDDVDDDDDDVGVDDNDDDDDDDNNIDDDDDDDDGCDAFLIPLHIRFGRKLSMLWNYMTAFLQTR